MIYKVVEDKKWEYKTVEVTHYDFTHNQLNTLLDGDDGWECFAVKEINGHIFFFLKRSYIEIEKQ